MVHIDSSDVAISYRMIQPTGKRGRGRPRKNQASESATASPPPPQLKSDSGLFVFDIETGPADIETLNALFDPASVKCGNLKDPAKIAEKVAAARESFVERAALDPITGRVLAIGTQSDGGYAMVILGDDYEFSILSAFWSLVEESLANRHPIIGWNIHDFDLPFLINRSRILNVAVPSGLRHGRYWNDLIIDLMKVWTLDRYGEYAKLNDVGRALGLGGKLNGVDPAQFHILWRDDRPKAIEYLTRDVELTAAIAERLTIV